MGGGGIEENERTKLGFGWISHDNVFGAASGAANLLLAKLPLAWRRVAHPRVTVEERQRLASVEAALDDRESVMFMVKEWQVVGVPSQKMQKILGPLSNIFCIKIPNHLSYY